MTQATWIWEKTLGDDKEDDLEAVLAEVTNDEALAEEIVDDDLDALLDAVDEISEDDSSSDDLSLELDDEDLNLEDASVDEVIKDESTEEPDLVVSGGDFASLTEEALSEASVEHDIDDPLEETMEDELNEEDSLGETSEIGEEHEDLVVSGGEFASLTEEALSEALGEKVEEHELLDEEIDSFDDAHEDDLSEDDLAVEEVPAQGLALDGNIDTLKMLLESLDNDKLRSALKGMKISVNISFDEAQ